LRENNNSSSSIDRMAVNAVGVEVDKQATVEVGETVVEDVAVVGTGGEVVEGTEEAEELVAGVKAEMDLDHSMSSTTLHYMQSSPHRPILTSTSLFTCGVKTFTFWGEASSMPNPAKWCSSSSIIQPT